MSPLKCPARLRSPENAIHAVDVDICRREIRQSLIVDPCCVESLLVLPEPAGTNKTLIVEIDALPAQGHDHAGYVGIGQLQSVQFKRLRVWNLRIGDSPVNRVVEGIREMLGRLKLDQSLKSPDRRRIKAESFPDRVGIRVMREPMLLDILKAVARVEYRMPLR